MENKEFIVDGTKYETKVHKKFLMRKKYEPANPKIVTTKIPGVVESIFVVVGQRVKAGDQLMILEAMKMKNIIRASRECVIKSIYVQQGKQVPKDSLLLEFDWD